MPRTQVNPRDTLVTHAPCRVDLAGGTMDIWPLYLFHPGAVTVNIAVNVVTTCRITPLPGKRIHLLSTDTNKEDWFANLDVLSNSKKYQHPLAAHLVKFFQPEGGLKIETHSESPAGAGISGSSALMIATTAALAECTGRMLGLEEIRVIAQNVEAQLIKVPTGCQDYYPALYGGASAIHLDPDGIHRRPIPVPLEEIDRRFVLAYTGAPRQSGINNWEVFKAHIENDKHVLKNFESIRDIAQAMNQALNKSDWKEVTRLLREEWKLRRTNAPGITTKFIDHLIEVSMKHGGRAAKVCGAGGGGCVIFLVDEDARDQVETALRAEKATVLPFRVAREGLTLKRMAASQTAR
jgi:D-glycero-alpha-D-manno-heptose-7-phosphate kinase